MSFTSDWTQAGRDRFPLDPGEDVGYDRMALADGDQPTRLALLGGGPTTRLSVTRKAAEPRCRPRTGQLQGTARLNNGVMGRASRRRAERRAGERELTPKEIRRYAEKANRRARRLEPTVDDFTRAAGQGSIRLAEALIARSTIRMDNIPEIPAEYSMAALESITSMLALDKALAKIGIPLRRMPSDYQGRLPRHLAWGVDSSIAACRLLLVGQIAGAAVSPVSS
jgi:hypothetical protein